MGQIGPNGKIRTESLVVLMTFPKSEINKSRFCGFAKV